MAKGLDEIIDLIYAAGSFSASWQDVADSIVEYAGARSCFMQYQQEADEPVSRFVLSGLDDGEIKFYAENFSQRDNTIKILEDNFAFGKIITSEETFPNLRSITAAYGKEYYYNILKGFKMDHLAATIVDSNRGKHSTFSLQRDKSAGPIDGDLLTEMQSLIPHFKRSFRLHQQLDKLNIENHGWQKALDIAGIPVAIVDASFNLVVWSKGFEELLIKDVVRLKRNGFTFHCREADLQIKKSIINATNILQPDSHPQEHGESVVIRTKKDNPSFVCSISPVSTKNSVSSPFISHSRAILLFKPLKGKNDSGIELISSHYGLSKSETNVVMWLASGKSIRDIANLRSRSIHTVRNQVKAVFEKTATTSQKDLVRLLMSYS